MEIHFQKNSKLYYFLITVIIKLCATHWLERRGEAGCGAPLTAQQLGGGWLDHTRPPLAGRCMTRLLSGPGGGVVWLGGEPLLAALLGCWM